MAISTASTAMQIAVSLFGVASLAGPAHLSGTLMITPPCLTGTAAL